MKITLPIIGEVATGKDIGVEPSVIAVTPDTKNEKLYDVIGGMVNLSRVGLSNQKTISNKLLKANTEWVYRNNDVIAQEVAAIDFQLYSMDIKGGQIEFNEIDDHPLLDLLDKFNTRTTKTDGIYTTQSHKKLTGDAFWYLEKNGAVIDGIHILQPDNVEIIIASETDKNNDLISGYKYVDTIDNKQVERLYDAEDVVHFKKPNPRNAFRGYGAVEALSETIDTDVLINQTQRNFFEKGAITNFVLTTEARITQDQLKRLRAEMNAAYAGASNAFKTMIFGNGLKPSPVGFSNKDMDFLKLLEWYRDKIMIGFGNTKASIGIVDDVNRASFDGSHSGWLRGTVKPDMDSIVNTLNEFLVPMYGENLILGYVDPVPQDITDDITEAVQLKDHGIMTINEAREKVGLDPVPNGDIFAPVGNVSTPGNEKQPVNPNDPNAATDDKKPAEEDDKNKRIYRKASSRFKNLPSGLVHIKIQPILRKRGIYLSRRLNQQVKEAVKPLIAKTVANKHTPIVKKDAPRLTPAIMEEYFGKQIHLVDVFETQFHDKVLGLIEMIQKDALSTFETEIRGIKSLRRFMAKKELVDTDKVKVEAQINLYPILMQEIILAGQEAYSLIGVEDVYVPFKIQESVRRVIDKFAESMAETDKDLLAKIIADGVADGSSITEIRDNITSKFSDYSKMQAERITRTEVIRAANMAAEDAFIQSGVVEAKEWLTASDPDEICAPYRGKIVKLSTNFYSPDESGFQDGNPPLHINCRCIIAPIVTIADAIQPDNTKILVKQAERITELEAQMDKRTRAFKEMKSERSDDAIYIKQLEKHLGIDDES